MEGVSGAIDAMMEKEDCKEISPDEQALSSTSSKVNYLFFVAT